jgi:hypothetical protein
MALTTNIAARAKKVTSEDPTIPEIGPSTDLNNYLPDSSVTQHMTPRLADLFNVEEGLNLGIEVADCHIIFCSTIGKIKINMLDDHGCPLQAILYGVMYVPGLNCRLFSVTKFADHGHYAIICHNAVTLYFGVSENLITVPITNGLNITFNARLSSVQPAIIDQHEIPSSRSRDKNKNLKRISLELLHQRFGHRKCRTLIAGSENTIWADTTIRMSPEEECILAVVQLPYGHATATHSLILQLGTAPGETIVIEILHNTATTTTGLTGASSFPFHLIIGDTFSRYSKIYELINKTTATVIKGIKQFAANHNMISSQYNFVNIDMLVHARLPNIYTFHAILYATAIVNVLSV